MKRVINKFLKAEKNYYQGLLTIKELSNTISNELSVFNSSAYIDIYNALLKLDAQIDSIIFTVSNDEQIQAVRKCFEDFKSSLRL